MITALQVFKIIADKAFCSTELYRDTIASLSQEEKNAFNNNDHLELRKLLNKSNNSNSSYKPTDFADAVEVVQIK